MDSGSTFSWLHVSDLHVGMSGSAHLWPQIKAEIFKDLERHFRIHGPIDLVIFSGDLTQMAKEVEFENVFKNIAELWELFNNLGANPKLFIVPGNHDLQRPAEDSSVVTAVDSWRKRPKVRESLLYKDESHSRIEMKKAFENYENFILHLIDSEIPLIQNNKGIFPGDSSGAFEINGLRIGLVGLNSAWSQLEGGDFFGRLEFCSEQVSEAVAGDIEKWTFANHINLLITHHPKEWFNSEALKDFNHEINPLGRFDAHLFGHMHELNGRLYGYGGSQVKREFQAASLFSSEEVKGDAEPRRHGFLLAKIDAEKEVITLWPRKAARISGGGWRVNVDPAELPDGGDCAESEIKIRELRYSSKKKGM